LKKNLHIATFAAQKAASFQKKLAVTLSSLVYLEINLKPKSFIKSIKTL